MPKLQLAVVESPRIVRPSRRRSVQNSLRSIFISGNSSQLNNQHLLPPASSKSLQQITSNRRYFSSVSCRLYSPLIQRHAHLLQQNSSPKPEGNSTSAPIRHNGVYVATFNPARRAFHETAVKRKDHHFDTLKVVQRLKNEGFSEEQAVALMKVMTDVIEESMQNLTRAMVSREDAERSTYTQKVDFAKLRSELLNSDSTEAQLTRSSHDKIAGDLAKLNSRLRDEIGRTQASVRLDLNLEKGRIREESNGQEMRIKETETRIEQEVAGVRERVEAVKFSTLQWLMGVCTGTAALILGAWRLLM
ncbi:Protein fmp32, mitochondrial [Microsporum canis]|uniref:DUF1640 domain-containing protein n=1 Tax=Arthroderma otae (strain ATCC MYA-4605 / CBS 113480) TaxID=554155 RepID=C5FY03_ARTOC|nr:DUF1640 domain-containing protein [Microsporum canis CBS 113480]EEQ34401.1 DUF1640 domain-containing protein [Microsporum canis CBS 113480]